MKGTFFFNLHSIGWIFFPVNSPVLVWGGHPGSVGKIVPKKFSQKSYPVKHRASVQANPRGPCNTFQGPATLF